MLLLIEILKLKKGYLQNLLNFVHLKLAIIKNWKKNQQCSLHSPGAHIHSFKVAWSLMGLVNLLRIKFDFNDNALNQFVRLDTFLLILQFATLVNSFLFFCCVKSKNSNHLDEIITICRVCQKNPRYYSSVWKCISITNSKSNKGLNLN